MKSYLYFVIKNIKYIRIFNNLNYILVIIVYLLYDFIESF